MRVDYRIEYTRKPLGAAESLQLLRSGKQRARQIWRHSSSSYSDRQICVVSRDTFYYADNVSGGKAIIRAVYQGDSLHTEQIYNLAFSKKHPDL